MGMVAVPGKVGVYVDAANIYRNGGSRMQYDILRAFACRDGAEPVRLNVYVTYDAERAETDYTYREKAAGFHSALRDFGYKVIVKEIKWYEDDAGTRYGKANSDLDLAVDALLQSEKLDRVLIATGDGDFVQVVRALQNKGCRVEIVAFNNVSVQLRKEADMFMSGYLIPELTPIAGANGALWGEPYSIVRGWCYYYNEEKGFGYMRFLRHISPDLWVTDSRDEASPYDTAFFHFSRLQDSYVQNKLPSRELIFEFKLVNSDRGDNFNAVDIRLVSEL
jgi:uncharacterized LabA/DUF88 family protein